MTFMSVRILVRCDLPGIRPLHALWRRTYSPIHLYNLTYIHFEETALLSRDYMDNIPRNTDNTQPIYTSFGLSLCPNCYCGIMKSSWNLWHAWVIISHTKYLTYALNLATIWHLSVLLYIFYIFTVLRREHGSPALWVVGENFPICDMTFTRKFSRSPDSVKLVVWTQIIMAAVFHTTSIYGNFIDKDLIILTRYDGLASNWRQPIL